jgi:hypothetical protein
MRASIAAARSIRLGPCLLRRYAFEVLSRHVESPARVLLADVNQEDVATVESQRAEILDDDALPVDTRDLRGHVVATFSESVGVVRADAMIFTVSPGTRKSQRLTVVGGDFIERCGEDVEGAAPAVARAEVDRHRFQGALRALCVDVVMSDRVAPRDERP